MRLYFTRAKGLWLPLQSLFANFQVSKMSEVSRAKRSLKELFLSRKRLALPATPLYHRPMTHTTPSLMPPNAQALSLLHLCSTSNNNASVKKRYILPTAFPIPHSCPTKMHCYLALITANERGSISTSSQAVDMVSMMKMSELQGRDEFVLKISKDTLRM